MYNRHYENLPSGWLTCSLSTVTNIFNGDSINEQEKSKKYTGLSIGHNYIGTKDVLFNHAVNYNSGVKIPYGSQFKIAHKGAPLLCIEGGSAGRKICILQEDVCFGNKLCAFESYGIDNLFLYYFLQSSTFKYVFKKNTQGIIGGVSINTIKALPFYMPPLSEQQRIVKCIEELLVHVDSIENNQYSIEQLYGDLKSRVLDLAIRGKLIPQDPKDESASELLKRIRAEKKAQLGKKYVDSYIYKGDDNCYYEHIDVKSIDEPIETPFKIPDSWCWVRIPDVTFFQEGPGIMAKDFRQSGIPLIRISGMKSNRVSLEGCNYLDIEMVAKKWKHFCLDKGDVVISTSASMDKIAEVYEDTVGAIPYTGLIRFKMQQTIIKDYFKYFIKSECYIKQIDTQKSGTTIQHYGPTHLQRMLVPIPPLAEQKRIVDKISEIFAKL